MRDLTEDPHPTYTASVMADLTGRFDGKAPRIPVDGHVAEKASQHHAGAGEAQRASVGLLRRPVEIAAGSVTIDALLSATKGYVHAVWDLARARAAEAGPMPLVSAEAWVEGDEAYRKRLRGVPRRMLWTWDELDGDDLTGIGEEVGLPRARLVPVEG